MTARRKLALAWAFLALLLALSAWAGWYAPVGPDGFDQREVGL